MQIRPVTRRRFLGTAAAVLALPVTGARAATKFKRSLVTSPDGQKALASYAKGVEVMLNLPADDPRNWFRNAFIHLMDCPHGNWWFFVWHRGYLGYFEQTIRSLSGDPNFALPYWDWTQLLSPQPHPAPAFRKTPSWGIPDALFNGVLTPTDPAFQPYTANLEVFTDFIKQELEKYWNGLKPAQKAQLAARGYVSFDDDVWNGQAGVTGGGVAGNEAFAVTCSARYLSRTNPLFDADTATAVSKTTVAAGLLAPKFYDPTNFLSFTSSKTRSHNESPSGPATVSVIEGQPHNLVHNDIGGGGHIDPGPYGNMYNFLSPVDPIFFLHHANIDRLWDVWTRRQISLNQPHLPPDDELKVLSDEPFLFFVDFKGNPILNGKAGDYLSTDVFDYEYDRLGFGEQLIETPQQPVAQAPVAAEHIAANTASVRVPAAAMAQQRVAAEVPRPLVAQITLQRPTESRQVRVFVGAPADATNLDTDSPYFAGTIGFFGPPMAGMQMSHEATFAVPLPPQNPALAAPLAAAETHANLTVTVVPLGGKETAPVLKAVSIGSI
jgi:tyrosinase